MKVAGSQSLYKLQRSAELNLNLSFNRINDFGSGHETRVLDV